MGRIWAVARHMVAEGIRMKIAMVFIAVLLILLPALPFAVEGDGVTLKSKVQSFLAYSLGAVSFLLSVLTVFLACGALNQEISTRQIHMIVTKPIPRWQFFVGKWLGIMMLNAGLLLLAGLSVWGFTWYLKSQPTVVPGDAKALEQEVLRVRHGIPLRVPENQVEEVVRQRIRQLREEGRLDAMGPDAIAQLEEQFRREVRRGYRSIGPGDGRQYAFEGLIVNREEGEFLLLSLKPKSSAGVEELSMVIGLQAGDLDDFERTVLPWSEDELLINRVNTIPVPTRAVNEAGTLYVRLLNLDPEYTLTFETGEDFEVLFGIGTFHWNLFRALTIIWCKLAFLAALGLFASSWLSFPVACMFCFVVLIIATSAGFLIDAMDWVSISPTGEDPLPVIGHLSRPLGQAVLVVIPDLSAYDPVGRVVDGRVVTLMWVLWALGRLVLVQGLILGVLGCVIFTKREVAQVVV